MLDEDTARLALRIADQPRSHFANVESDLEYLTQQANQLPTARDLWRQR
jgi:hypothetical protein